MFHEREPNDKRIRQDNEESEATSVDQTFTLQGTGQNRVDVRAWILCNSILKDTGYSYGLFLMVFVNQFQSTKVHMAFICLLLCGAYLCAGKKSCNCKNSIMCEIGNGDCSSVCKAGYYGSDCGFQCEPGWYGDKCGKPCECKSNESCNTVDGNCAGGECEICKIGWNCHTSLAELIAKNSSLPPSFGFQSTNNGKSHFTSFTTSVTNETKRSYGKSVFTSLTTSVRNETKRSSFSYNNSTIVSPVEMKPPVKIDLIVACTLAFMFITCVTVTYYLHKKKIPSKIPKREKSHISFQGLNRISEIYIQEDSQSDVESQAADDAAEVMENDLQSAHDLLSGGTPPFLTQNTVNDDDSSEKRLGNLLTNERSSDNKRNTKTTNEKSSGLLNKIKTDVMQTGQNTQCRRCSRSVPLRKLKDIQ